jgi:hypothetical protein
MTRVVHNLDGAQKGLLIQVRHAGSWRLKAGAHQLQARRSQACLVTSQVTRHDGHLGLLDPARILVKHFILHALGSVSHTQ